MIAEWIEKAELAIAAYADLMNGATDPQIQALRAAGMTETQAQEFAKRYPSVILPYHDLSGFSATVFKDTAGNLTLAIRGTNDSGDYDDDLDILGYGAAYEQIVAMVNWWKRVSTSEGNVQQYRLASYDPGLVPQGAIVIRTEDTRVVVLESAGMVAATGELSTVLGQEADGKVDVTGHSLGGHLAMAFSTIFASQTGQTVVFNAPGFIDSEDNQAFFGGLGGVVPAGLSAAAFFNVAANEALVAEDPFSPIAGLWSRPGQHINISIERQWSSDEPNPQSPWNHSMVVLADSLAVFKLLKDLAPAFSEADYQQVLNQAVTRTAAGYERIVGRAGEPLRRQQC